MSDAKDHYVRVGDLRELLDSFPADMPVVMQKDSEGNGFSPLSGGEKAVYVPVTTWYGDVYSEEDAEEFVDDVTATEALILFPIN